MDGSLNQRKSWMRRGRMLFARVSLVTLAGLAALGGPSTVGAVPGTYTSSMTIQNNNTVTANVTIRLYKPDGTEALTTPLTYTIPASQGQLIYVPNIAGLAAGRYSVAVDSDVPVVATVNGSATGAAFSYQSVRVTDAATTAYVPGVYKSYHGFTSAVTVQNTASTIATVTVTYLNASNATVGTDTATIASNATVTFDQGTTAGLTAGYHGSARITSTQPVIGLYTVYNTFSGASDAGTAISGGATKVYAPITMKNYYGWHTSVVVQNMATESAQVKLTFTGADAAYTETATIPSGSSQLFWQGNSPGSLPDKFIGALTVESTNGKEIAVVVNQALDAGSYAVYAATPASRATTIASMPTIMNGYYGWVTSFTVQNVDTIPATVTYTYTANGSGTVVRTATETLLPGQSKLHYQPNEGLPNPFLGTVQAVSDGAKIIAIVNQTQPAQTGDSLMNYSAFNTVP